MKYLQEFCEPPVHLNKFAEHPPWRESRLRRRVVQQALQVGISTDRVPCIRATAFDVSYRKLLLLALPFHSLHSHFLLAIRVASDLQLLGPLEAG